MRYTNKFNLPDAFKRAVLADPYDRGDTYSPSMLNSPPRAIVLAEKHGADFEVDISSRVASTLGQGAHSILERAARKGIDIIEKRFLASVDIDGRTYYVSAQIDLYESDTKTLSDWKTTKSYAFNKKTGSGKKPEWVSQLNMGKWIMSKQKKPIPVERMQIVGILKDWDPKKAEADTGYPQTEIATVEIKGWPVEKTEEWVIDRIKAILNARKELPFCTAKETWGGKRCGRWCDASQVCSQYQNSLKTGIMKTEKAEVW